MSGRSGKQHQGSGLKCKQGSLHHLKALLLVSIARQHPIPLPRKRRGVRHALNLTAHILAASHPPTHPPSHHICTYKAQAQAHRLSTLSTTFILLHLPTSHALFALIASHPKHRHVATTLTSEYLHQ